MTKDLNTTLKTIKLMATKHYEVILVELPSGSYRVGCEVHGQTTFSETIKDFNTASYIFDLKLRELEGH